MASGKSAQLMVIKRQSRLTSYLFGLATFCVMSTGCAMVGSNYEQPALPMLSSNYQIRDSQLQPAQDLDSWWQSFSDPTLDQLVSRALANNLTVQVAGEQVIESQATLNLKGKNSLCGNSNCGIDLFGRVERTQQAAQAELLSKKFSLQDVQHALVADVATNYLDIRLLQNQIEIAEQSLQLQQETTSFVSGQAEAGVVTKIDAEQTTAFLHRTRAQKAALEMQLDTEFNRLGILLGESPNSSLRQVVGFGQIPNAPYLPAAGIPADLIRRRPDIRQAEAEIGVAAALVGIAEADLYPTFKLLGSVSLGSQDSPSLFQTSSPAYVTPFLKWCMKRNGRICSNVEVHQSRLRQAVGGYRIAVLNAVKEVEDSMAMYDGYQKQLAELAIALQSDTRAVDLTRQRYDLGKADFQRVIDVQMQMLEDSQASAAARAKANIQLIKLYKAVGGGWSTPNAAIGCGCVESIAGMQDGCSGNFGNDASYMNEPSIQFQDAQYKDAQYSEFQNSKPNSQPNLEWPTDEQPIAPPHIPPHSVLEADDYGPLKLTPDFGQVPQGHPSRAMGNQMMVEMFDWGEQETKVANLPKVTTPNQQLSNRPTGQAVLAEMFDWSENEAAVVNASRQQQSPVSHAGYFAESHEANNEQKMPKASSIKSAPVVWDSEAVEVD